MENLIVPMARARLRAVGGSVMLAVPRALLDQIRADIGTELDIGVDEGRLVIAPIREKPAYSLDTLLAKCRFDEPLGADEIEWLTNHPAGDEIL